MGPKVPLWRISSTQTQETKNINNNNTDDENNFIGIILPGQRPTQKNTNRINQLSQVPGQRPTQKNTNRINQLSQVPGQRPTHYQKWLITLLPAKPNDSKPILN
jgi:hypothetical protein